MTQVRLSVAAGLAVAAATVTLAPVFQSGSYFWHCAGAVLAVGLSGYAARRLGLPRLLVPVATLAGLTMYLTLTYARDEAWFWVVPGGSGITALRALYDSGVEDIMRFAAPVRPYGGIVAITAGGVGLISVVVDFVAVTLRRPALAGLPLLALYCVPAAVVRDGVGWFPFAVGAVGFLGLLLVDGTERVRTWGRPLGRATTERASARAYIGEVETASLSRVGRRVGAVALGAALVVPAALPTLDEGVFGRGGPGFGSGSGSRTVNVVNPIVDLRRDLVRPENRTVIRYRTDDPDPGYLRMATLDTFTGETWIPAKLEATSDQDVGGGLPPPAGLADVLTVTRRATTLAIGDLRDARLPLPYPAVEVKAEGDWRYDEGTRNVFSFRNDTRGLRYEVVSLDVDTSAGVLRSSSGAGSVPSSAGYTNLPNDVPPIVGRLAAETTDGATTDYDKALALQQWLRGFQYSLEVRAGNSDSALVDFLRDRSGYCEQFAATMALMARAEGIPARVNVGFTQGRQLSDGTWKVTLHDAHAWPELYFAGVGWVPFEPTPRSDGTTPAPAYADANDVQAPGALPDGTSGSGSVAGSANPRSANERRTQQQLDLARRRLEGELGSQSPGAATTDETGDGSALPLVLVGALLVLAVTPAAARLVVRRTRRHGLSHTADGVLRAWREVEDTAWDHGAPRHRHETPDGFAARLVSEMALDGHTAEALHRLARACARVRFAPSVGRVGDVRGDLATVRTGIASAVVPSVRWRARLVPASTRALATRVSETTADGLDWLDESGARVRAAVARRVTRRRSTG